MERTTDSVELDAEPGTEPRHEGMGGFAKGLAIIEAFAVHDVMSVADAARASGATRAAARRCLLTLNELGYVERYGREFRPPARRGHLQPRARSASIRSSASGSFRQRCGSRNRASTISR